MEYNPFSLKGKTILVTGASSGIGRATAIECSKLGANLIITGRNIERLEATFSLLEGRTHKYVIADLSKKEDYKHLVSSIDYLDGIVHSAGFLKKLPLKFISEKSLLETFQLNFVGPTILTQQLYKNKKIKNNASIVFISSIAANIASIGNITYMASKGAINSLVKGMALELADKNIRVNYIEPALIKTSLVENAMTQEDLNNYQKKFPLGRFGKPEEVAHAAIYFMSDAAQWITGIGLRIDGGVTLK